MLDDSLRNSFQNRKSENDAKFNHLIFMSPNNIILEYSVHKLFIFYVFTLYFDYEFN